MAGERTEKRDGFSLIELVIVIALMGILVGGIGLSIGLLRAADTKEAAYAINGGLTDLKSRTTGGKDQPYMYLYSLNDTYYLDISYNPPVASGGAVKFTPTTDAKEIGDSRMQILRGSDKEELGDSPEGFVCIAFQKKDGAFLKNASDQCLQNGVSTCPEEIHVVGDGASEYVIHMIPDTGHHYVEEK